MANHKRGKPKNSRAGCLMCKRWKINHAPKDYFKARDQRIDEKAAYEVRND